MFGKIQVACITFMSLALVIIWWLLTASQKDIASPPTTPVLASRLDFGEVWEDTSFKWTMILENHSAAEISIDLDSSCSCTEMSPKTHTLTAGESQKLRLTIDLTSGASQRKAQDGLENFEVNISAQIRQNGVQEKTAAQWVIKGKVKRAVKFDKSFVNLGRHSDCVKIVPEQVITAKIQTPLTGITLSDPPPWLTFSLNQVGEDFQFSFRPKAGLAAGSYRTELTATTQLPDGSALRVAKLPIRLDILPDIHATPSRVSFGSRKKEEPCAEALALRSITDAPFEVLGWRVEGMECAISRIDSQPQSNIPTFLLRPKIVIESRRSGKAIFEIKSQDGAKSLIEVPFDYHCIASH
jgi:hypothetical protein